jgi:hypothetical protein
MGTPRARAPTDVTDLAVEVVADGMSLGTVATRRGTSSNTLTYHVNAGTTMAVLHF